MLRTFLRSRPLRLVLGVLSAIGAVACVEGSRVSGLQPQVHQVLLRVHDTVLVSCQTTTLRDTVVADSLALTGLIWRSSDSTVARPDSLGGVVALRPGVALVKAYAFTDSTKFDTARVHVVDAPGPFLTFVRLLQSDSGESANLAAVHDSVDVFFSVTVPGCRTTPLTWVTLYTTLANSQDTLRDSLSLPHGFSGAVYIRMNTAALGADSLPKLPNGSYLLSARVVSNTGTVAAAPNPVQLTLANRGG